MILWYFLPYPFTESEAEDTATAYRPPLSRASPTSSSGIPSRLPKPVGRSPKISSVQRTTLRSHGRTSELLAGGLTQVAL
ncbi:hypothetical protein EDC04DRAFT_2828557, partial [Pisolithus marmoratus]